MEKEKVPEMYLQEKLEDYALLNSDSLVFAPSREELKDEKGPNPQIYSKLYGRFERAMSEYGLIPSNERNSNLRQKIVGKILEGEGTPENLSEIEGVRSEREVRDILEELGDRDILEIKENNNSSTIYSINPEAVNDDWVYKEVRGALLRKLSKEKEINMDELSSVLPGGSDLNLKEIIENLTIGGPRQKGKKLLSRSRNTIQFNKLGDYRSSLDHAVNSEILNEGKSIAEFLDDYDLSYNCSGVIFGLLGYNPVKKKGISRDYDREIDRGGMRFSGFNEIFREDINSYKNEWRYPEDIFERVTEDLNKIYKGWGKITPSDVLTWFLNSESLDDRLEVLKERIESPEKFIDLLKKSKVEDIEREVKIKGNFIEALKHPFKEEQEN